MTLWSVSQICDLAELSSPFISELWSAGDCGRDELMGRRRDEAVSLNVSTDSIEDDDERRLGAVQSVCDVGGFAWRSTLVCVAGLLPTEVNGEWMAVDSAAVQLTSSSSQVCHWITRFSGVNVTVSRRDHWLSVDCHPPRLGPTPIDRPAARCRYWRPSVGRHATPSVSRASPTTPQTANIGLI